MATIQKRGETYRIRASAGYDGTGKQIMKSMTYKPTPGMTPKQVEKEVNRQATLFDEQVQSGHYLSGNFKFKEFTEQWFNDYAKDHLRDRTYYRYKELTERTYQALGHIRLDRLQPHHLLEFYAQLAEPGQNKRTGGGLAPKTIKHYHTLISSVMERAVKWQIIKENPCRRIDPPKVDKHEIEYLNDEEAAKFLQCLESESIQFKALFALLLFTGIRRGELLGLEWQDINFDTGVIKICRTLQYTAEKGTFTDDTKTEQSKRSIKAPDSVMALLQAHKMSQLEHRLKMGDKWQDCGRVFTRDNGLPMGSTTPYNRLQKILKSNGMRKVNIHSLRHTNATLLINQGVNIRTISGRLGHSQTSTTMNIYAHQLQSADAAAADALELKLGGHIKQA